MTLLQIEKTAAADDSLPLLRLGFRPFFLLAGISAIVLILSWLYLFNAGAGVTLYGAISWHAHEMLFGFAVAVIAGFLLTAVSRPRGALVAAAGLVDRRD